MAGKDGSGLGAVAEGPVLARGSIRSRMALMAMKRSDLRSALTVLLACGVVLVLANAWVS
jgi:hypothetical protein